MKRTTTSYLSKINKRVLLVFTLCWYVSGSFAQDSSQVHIQSIFKATQEIVNQLTNEQYYINTLHIDTIDSNAVFYPTFKLKKDFGIFAIGDEHLLDFSLEVQQRNDKQWESIYSGRTTPNTQNFILMSIPWQDDKEYRFFIKRLSKETESPSQAYFSVIAFYD